MAHKHSLSFQCSKESTNREAIFKTELDRQEYMKFEAADLKAKDAFFAYAAARTREQRNNAAKALDEIRYSCYRRWRNGKTKTLPGPKVVA